MFKKTARIGFIIAIGALVTACVPGKGGDGHFVVRKEFKGANQPVFNKAPMRSYMQGRWVTESMNVVSRNSLRTTEFIADNSQSVNITHTIQTSNAVRKTPDCVGTIKYHGFSENKFYFVERLRPSSTHNCPIKTTIIIEPTEGTGADKRHFYGRYSDEGNLIEKGFAYRK